MGWVGLDWIGLKLDKIRLDWMDWVGLELD